MFIVQFLLFIFLFGFVVVAFVVWRTWRRIKHATDQLKQQMGGTADAEPQGDVHRATTTENGDTIIDTRSKEKANRKIFAEDEGEYVDYKEQ